jgi:uncharacterized protein YceH (UPF0502 family)
MPKNALTTDERARLKAELEARRAALRVEVKAQLAGSGDDRVVGLRNRIQESGDEWGVADGLAELDLAEVRHVLADLTSRRSPDARKHVWRLPVRDGDRASRLTATQPRDAASAARAPRGRQTDRADGRLAVMGISGLATSRSTGRGAPQ